MNLAERIGESIAGLVGFVFLVLVDIEIYNKNQEMINQIPKDQVSIVFNWIIFGVFVAFTVFILAATWFNIFGLLDE